MFLQPPLSPDVNPNQPFVVYCSRIEASLMSEGMRILASDPAVLMQDSSIREFQPGDIDYVLRSLLPKMEEIPKSTERSDSTEYPIRFDGLKQVNIVGAALAKVAMFRAWILLEDKAEKPKHTLHNLTLASQGAKQMLPGVEVPLLED